MFRYSIRVCLLTLVAFASLNAATTSVPVVEKKKPWDFWGLTLGVGPAMMKGPTEKVEFSDGESIDMSKTIPMLGYLLHIGKSLYLGEKSTVEFALSMVHPAVHFGRIINDKHRVSIGVGFMPLALVASSIDATLSKRTVHRSSETHRYETPLRAKFPLALHLGWDVAMSERILFRTRFSYAFAEIRKREGVSSDRGKHFSYTVDEHVGYAHWPELVAGICIRF